MYWFEIDIADTRYRGEKALTYHYDKVLRAGQPVTVNVKGRGVSGFVRGRVSKPEFKTLPVKQVLSEAVLPKSLLGLAFWLGQYYAVSLGESMRLLAPARPIKRKSNLAKKPLELRSDWQEPPTLTSAQKDAVQKISKQPGTSLLYGTTASGKTEVYINLAKKNVAKGKSVILLTPEIALTTQFTNYVKKRLSCDVYVVHSAMPASQRKKLWLNILESTEPVVLVGPRSALFFPVQNLGLIVVDEAHETAYKQQNPPRYHALRVASKLGELAKAKVVLGTATPDLVDYYLARQKNRLIEITKPAKATSKPEISIINLTDKTNFAGNIYLSDKLLSEIEKVLGEGRQAMVYLNRRGTARLIMCSNCGWQQLCPKCNQPMVYHGDLHKAVCHSCGSKKTPPTLCPVCGSQEVIYKSVGTKAIADFLQARFKNHRVARFDSDNQPGERIEQNYQAVFEGEVDILVGTQLLAKGFDLPRLGLVGVVIADTSLYLPDYRADERTYQLLKQVAGRVSRGHGAGKVVIQAYNPDSPAIQAVVNSTSDEFFADQLSQRQFFNYPPFCYLLKLSVRRASSLSAQSSAQKLIESLVRISGIQLFDPVPAFREKSSGGYTWQVVIKSRSRPKLVKIAQSLPSGWSADLDPTNLL